MHIHFYLNDAHTTEITTFHDMVSNPFSVSDVLELTVNDLYPTFLSKFKKETQVKMLEQNDASQKLFRRRKVRIISESKYVSFAVATDPTLIIEYYCVFVSE